MLLKRHFRLLAIAAGLYTPLFGYGQDTPANAEKVKLIQADLDFLAGEKCEGRGLQTKGILQAGEYIADAFKAAGLKPAFKDGFFQPFEVPAPSELGTPINLSATIGSTTTELKVMTDAVATVASKSSTGEYDLVFAGYGLSAKEPAYDDYADLDVKGKVVVLLRRTPRADDAKNPFGANNAMASLVFKINAAVERGAVGVVFVSDSGTAGAKDDLLKPETTRGAVPIEGPVLHVKRSVADAWLNAQGRSLKDWESETDRTMKPNSFALTGVKLKAEVTVVKKTWPTRNVVGVCEGNGPLKDETIVMGAHYDHLGYGEPGSFPGSDGKVHYGADDNGSGTSGLLELVRRYGPMKNREGRRIVFIAFSGEEQGLFGSLHYANNPVFDIKDTIFMLNMDMIGRLTMVDVNDANGTTVKKDRIVVYGTGTSTGMDELVEKKNAEFNFQLMKIPGGQGPSDHTSFYNKGIPVLFFFTGTHKDYHRPTDTPDKINVPGLLKVADYAQTFVDHFSTVKDRPDYLKTKGGSEDPTDPNRNVSRVNIPRIGIMPGNYGEEDAGVLVEAVTKDGPAEKGGMKDGDLIIEIGGKPVRNMAGYMQAMGAVKPGSETNIVVVRKGEKVTLKVAPMK